MISKDFIEEQSKLVQQNIKMLMSVINNIDIDSVPDLEESKKKEFKKDLNELKSQLGKIHFGKDGALKNQQLIEKLTNLQAKYNQWRTS